MVACTPCQWVDQQQVSWRGLAIGVGGTRCSRSPLCSRAIVASDSKHTMGAAEQDTMHALLGLAQSPEPQPVDKSASSAHSGAALNPGDGEVGAPPRTPATIVLPVAAPLPNGSPPAQSPPVPVGYGTPQDAGKGASPGATTGAGVAVPAKHKPCPIPIKSMPVHSRPVRQSQPSPTTSSPSPLPRPSPSPSPSPDTVPRQFSKAGPSQESQSSRRPTPTSDFRADTILRGLDGEVDPAEVALSDMPVRKGKWTRQEENYTACLIRDFRTGMLGVPEGTTLRCHLAKALRCDPMRITKKFAGREAIGKQVYRRYRPSSADMQDLATKFHAATLARNNLRRAFLERVRAQYKPPLFPKARRWSGNRRGNRASNSSPSQAQGGRRPGTGSRTPVYVPRTAGAAPAVPQPLSASPPAAPFQPVAGQHSTVGNADGRHRVLYKLDHHPGHPGLQQHEHALSTARRRASHPGVVGTFTVPLRGGGSSLKRERPSPHRGDGGPRTPPHVSIPGQGGSSLGPSQLSPANPQPLHLYTSPGRGGGRGDGQGTTTYSSPGIITRSPGIIGRSSKRRRVVANAARLAPSPVTKAMVPDPSAGTQSQRPRARSRCDSNDPAAACALFVQFIDSVNSPHVQ